ncbi:tyrosine recombinase XerC [Leeia sp. TBRC 13508]|uniref:Tyrosine recombinase XerC n=1 Tax=Leeia speluncae TaxID=2884804 RepID=A0ABS8D3C5_9NEIS|nr:tyrosine recombinase XerC [Leeia speluncae]MCB6182674.1 tyrosine recombinase XerC [Leeia speluncae]
MENGLVIRQFLDWLKLQRQASPHTLSAYQLDLAQLEKTDVAFAELTAKDIRNRIAELAESGLSARSIARTLSAWRRCYAYMMQFHGWASNPCEGIRAPRMEKKLPEVVTPDLANYFLDSITGDEPIDIRDRAMFELLYSCGLRVSELVGLETPDIDLQTKLLHVRMGKGKKSRLVPFGESAKAAIQAWLPIRPVNSGTAIFTNQHGDKLTTRSVQLRIKHHGLKAGIPQNLYPHLLRHACASHLLQSSQDLRGVQEMLGHASIVSTQVYTHLDFQHLASVYDATHPRAKEE